MCYRVLLLVLGFATGLTLTAGWRSEGAPAADGAGRPAARAEVVRTHPAAPPAAQEDRKEIKKGQNQGQNPGQRGTAQDTAGQAPTRRPDVIYVPTPPEVVDKMLELAEVKKGDVVYDLGCGDGRIVVAAAKK